MTDGMQALHRPPGEWPRRGRRRWLVAAGLAGGWLLLLYLTGSVVGGTGLLLLLAALGAGSVLALRSLGAGAGHPWLRPLAAWPGAGLAHVHDGSTRTAATLGTVAAGAGLATLAEPRRAAIPPLTLVTGDRVTRTSTSGACAGRGAVDLVLPQVPTISREHARFTFAGGQWWIVNLGRNGLTLNGVPLAGEQVLGDGDVIGWGCTPGAPVSRVEIG